MTARPKPVRSGPRPRRPIQRKAILSSTARTVALPRAGESSPSGERVLSPSLPLADESEVGARRNRVASIVQRSPVCRAMTREPLKPGHDPTPEDAEPGILGWTSDEWERSTQSGEREQERSTPMRVRITAVMGALLRDLREAEHTGRLSGTRSPGMLARGQRTLLRSGLVAQSDGGFVLTASGRSCALPSFMPCVVEGCLRLSNRQGARPAGPPCGYDYCAAHRARTERHGTPLGGRPQDWSTRTPEERFWGMVDRSAGLDACWPWLGTDDQRGYGQITMWVDGRHRTRRASRMAYELRFGTFDPALFVLHRCDNPPCVNPAHLFIGTHTDNMRDARAKGRRPSRADVVPA